MLCRPCRRALIRSIWSPSAPSAIPCSRTLTIFTRPEILDLTPQRTSSPRLAYPIPTNHNLHHLQCYSSTAAPLPSSAADAAAPTASLLEKPDFLDDAESHIWDLLTAKFEPAELVVRDISGGCGSMYGIEISSEKFRGVNMLKQQRMVNAVLGDLMKAWHGVQLKTRVP